MIGVLTEGKNSHPVRRSRACSRESTMLTTSIEMIPRRRRKMQTGRCQAARSVATDTKILPDRRPRLDAPLLNRGGTLFSTMLFSVFLASPFTRSISFVVFPQAYLPEYQRLGDRHRPRHLQHPAIHRRPTVLTKGKIQNPGRATPTRLLRITRGHAEATWLTNILAMCFNGRQIQPRRQ